MRSHGSRGSRGVPDVPRFHRRRARSARHGPTRPSRPSRPSRPGPTSTASSRTRAAREHVGLMAAMKSSATRKGVHDPSMLPSTASSMRRSSRSRALRRSNRSAGKSPPLCLDLPWHCSTTLQIKAFAGSLRRSPLDGRARLDPYRRRPRQARQARCSPLKCLFPSRFIARLARRTDVRPFDVAVDGQLDEARRRRS